MRKMSFDARTFDIKATLNCGQIFRYIPYKDGYLVFSRDKACYAYQEKSSAVLQCEDIDYFYNFFDLERDYAAINEQLKQFGVPVLTAAADMCRGLRLLNQDREEVIFSFILSQNNNIPRIKKIIEGICAELGGVITFEGKPFRSFPTAAAIAARDAAFYKRLGAGYRDEYLVSTAKRIEKEGVAHLDGLPLIELKRALLSYKGVGPKVADCIALFGFKRLESFPVDTWIERLYIEDFNGERTERSKINRYFTSLFKEHSGLVQQYLFYYKRSLERAGK